MSHKSQHAEVESSKYVARHAHPHTFGSWVWTEDRNDRIMTLAFHLVWICMGVILTVISIALHWNDITAVSAPVAAPVIQEVWDFLFKLG
jgi:hypothetical protein